MRLQGWHLVVLIIVVVLLFGANRLPDLARAVGQSLKILKTEVKDLADDDKPPAGPTGRTEAPPAGDSEPKA